VGGRASCPYFQVLVRSDDGFERKDGFKGQLMRAAMALPCIKTIDRASLHRALEVYEVERLDFTEGYLVAQAEATGVGSVLSFDRSIDRIGTVIRAEP
jgi:hypothetical protein